MKKYLVYIGGVGSMAAMKKNYRAYCFSENCSSLTILILFKSRITSYHGRKKAAHLNENLAIIYNPLFK